MFFVDVPSTRTAFMYGGLDNAIRFARQSGGTVYGPSRLVLPLKRYDLPTRLQAPLIRAGIEPDEVLQEAGTVREVLWTPEME